jgi:hypothetical protein
MIDYRNKVIFIYDKNQLNCNDYGEESVNYDRMLMDKLFYFDYIVIEAIKYCFGIGIEHARFFFFLRKSSKYN